MTPRPVCLIIPSDSRYLSLMRHFLDNLLLFYKTPEDLIGKIVLCVDEACSNVIKYGYEGKKNQPIEISAVVTAGVLEIRIRDYGKQCDPKKFKPRPLDELRPGGLGTFFIKTIMDNVHYCTDRKQGTLLTMTKNLNAPAAKPAAAVRKNKAKGANHGRRI